MSDWNSGVIEEFRENGGKVGGIFEGRPLLLLHTTGAKSGQERVNPLVYRAVEGSYAVFASKGGAPADPGWFHNLVANSEATIEVGTDTIDVKARVLVGDERSSVWEPHKADYPKFAEYEQRTDREIPVVILEPVTDEPG